MPWIFDEREGPVGSISSYNTGEVRGETSSPGRVSMLMQEIFKPLHQAD